MAHQVVIQRKTPFSVGDILILLLIATTIYGVFAIGAQWSADFHPVTEIDLTMAHLPRYMLFSAIRGLVAYLLSLGFTLVVGYAAAKFRTAERIIIPMIDILQSVPPLGFLPGLALGLIALFPKTNIGLELVAIITIFTGQVWNMTFSFYSSLKAIPGDFLEAARVMGLTRMQRLRKLELPYSAVNLAWNSVLSMAGGWFFLNVCEAFTLGSREFRLPGVGAYMQVAVERGNTLAMVQGVSAMIIIIVFLDFVIWHPILAWVQRFRLENLPTSDQTAEPLMLLLMKESRFIRLIKFYYRRNFSKRFSRVAEHFMPVIPKNLSKVPIVSREGRRRFQDRYAALLGYAVLFLCATIVIFGTMRLIRVLTDVDGATWFHLLKSAMLTFLRVLGALAISTVWAVPVGIWLGLSPRRLRIAQPIIQILASFPAPMLYPLALTVFFAVGINLNWGAMFLMLMGVQWYVLFNVLAGSLKISRELSDTLHLMHSSSWDRWRTLYIPSVFPALVTGWVTAAGGAWNASIVAEYIKYKENNLEADGLGASITAAAASGDFKTLAASLTVMVVLVLLFNRTFWAKLYSLAQTRFRMDM